MVKNCHLCKVDVSDEPYYKMEAIFINTEGKPPNRRQVPTAATGARIFCSDCWKNSDSYDLKKTMTVMSSFHSVQDRKELHHWEMLYE